MIRKWTAVLLLMAVLCGSAAVAEGTATDGEAQQDCAHANTWTQETYTTKHISTDDPLYHECVRSYYNNINCEDCGTTGITREPLGEYTESYQHEWSGGVCTLCGQETSCEHANAWQQETYRADHVSTGDALYHECRYRFYYKLNCDDCGASSTAQDPFEEYTESYQHEWSGGECMLCGQDNTCAHANTWTQESYTAKHTSTDDPLYHECVRSYYNKVNCDDCGEMGITKELLGEYTESYQHEWSGGVCTLCGQETSCEHANAWQQETYRADHVSTGDVLYHECRYSFYYRMNCDDCGVSSIAQAPFEQYTESYQHEWSGGVCTLCGQENGCAHDNAWTQESYTAEHLSTADPMYHNYVYRLFNNKNCDDCGEIGFEQEQIDEYTETYQHEWTEDGVCMLCSQVNDCTHANIRTQESYTVEHISTGDNLYHDCAYVYFNVTSCADCGLESAKEITFEYTEPYTHWWSSAGVCRHCGQVNTCPHEGHIYTTEKYKDGVMSGIDDLWYHQCVYDVYTYTFCSDCEGMLSVEKTGTASELYQHEWNESNVCTVCGQANACPHANTWLQESYTAEHVSTDDPLYHDCLYRIYNNTNCDDCGATGIAQEQTDEYTEQYQHEWDESGVCSLCGQVNTCAHEEEDLTDTRFENERCEAIEGDNLQHNCLRDIYVYPVCVTCGMDLPAAFIRTDDPWTENHSWDESGACTQCAYVNTCVHDGETYWGNHEYKNYVYTSTGDLKYHTKDYESHIDIHCSLCQMYLSTQINPETIGETHTWVDGVCSLCGQVNACEHSGGTYIRESWSEEYYESTDHIGYHNLCIADMTHLIFCSICGMQTGEEYIGLQVNQQNHWWSASGETCGACGQVNTCEHTGETYHYDTYMNGRFESFGDPMYHHYLTDHYYDIYCSDCKIYLRQEYVGVETSTYDHNWNEEDVCDDCGQKPCAHENTETFSTTENHVYESTGNLQHINTYDVYDYEQCLDCGEQLTQPEFRETNSNEEWHDWNSENICSVCAHVNTCEHTGETQTMLTSTNFTYESYGDYDYHNICYDNYNSILCADCRVQVGYEFVESLVQQGMHVWDSTGVCISCRQVCAHKPSNSTELGYEMVFHDPVDQGDADFHLQPYSVIFTYQCNACQQTYTKTNEMEGEEGHTYGENGLCACGASGEPTTCLHENTEERYFDMNVSYSDVTEDTHTKTADEYFGMWCPDCGTYRMRQLNTPGVVTQEAHAYENGVCACGDVKGAELPKELRLTLPSALTVIGEEAFANMTMITHVVIPDSVTSIADNAFDGCSVTIVASEGSYAAQWAQAHGFAFEALSEE